MVNIQSPTAEIRRGKKKKEERNYRMKIYMVSLLHRATINYSGDASKYAFPKKIVRCGTNGPWNTRWNFF